MALQMVRHGIGFLSHGLGCRLLLAAASLSIALNSQAADGTWISGVGSGDWDDPSKWVGGNVAGGEGFTSTFDGAGSVVSLTSPTTIGSILASNWTGSAWRIQGDTLTLAVSSGAPIINIPGSGATSLEILSTMAGTSGLTLQGGGRLYLAGANTFTGGITVAAGILWTAHAASLNSNTITMSGPGTSWLIDGVNQTYASNVVLAADVAFSISSNDTVTTFSGDISESGGAQALKLVTNGGNARVVLQGDNSYTGNTVIGSGHNFGYVVARVEHDNGLGVGASNVGFAGGKSHDNDAVELANNVTISNKTLTLRGRGLDDAGSLRSVSGTNLWTGGVDTGDFGDATIGVDVGQLTISGTVSGTGAGGLAKVGEGTLVLSEGNTYSNGTSVVSGTLLVEHNAAVAGGGVTLGDGVGIDTLHVSAGVVLDVADFSLTSSAQLAFNLTGDFNATQIAVSGDQIGSGVFTVNIFDGGGFTFGEYVLLTVDGGFGATDFVLGNLPGSFAGSSLDWSGGVLTLNAVPEPSVYILLGLGLMVCIFHRRNHRKVS